MDFTIIYDDEIQAVIMTLSGELIADKVSLLIDAEVEMLKKHPNANLIYDQGDASGVNITSEDIFRISEDSARLAELLKGKKMAVVLVASLEYGLGRMWKSYTDAKVAFEITLFRDLSSAKKWIQQ